ncbi:MAG: TSUP family transporter [Eubacteriales bacterium]
MILIFLVGVIGGFFGMGGGWAITPVLNMGMGIPLKVAAANSGIILGVGSCVSVWPYIFTGGIIALFVLPWLSGQVVGGFVGSYILAKAKVSIVRVILIGIMAYTSFGLVTKGLEMMGAIGSIPSIVQVILFVAIIATVLTISVFMNKAGKKEEKENG